MSDRRHRSTRPALPEGYQYGDARPTIGIAIRFVKQFDITPDPHPVRMDDWRAPHENAAAQLMRRVKLTGDDRPGPAIPNIDAQRTGEETI